MSLPSHLNLLILPLDVASLCLEILITPSSVALSPDDKEPGTLRTEWLNLMGPALMQDVNAYKASWVMRTQLEMTWVTCVYLFLWSQGKTSYISDVCFTRHYFHYSLFIFLLNIDIGFY